MSIAQLSFFPVQEEIKKPKLYLVKNQVKENLSSTTTKNRNIPKHDNWKTDPKFYQKINEEFSFNFDPCPYEEAPENIDDLKNGLLIEWKERNFCNPPYSKKFKLKDKFILKALEESQKGKLCVLLLPVSTSTKIFHDVILPNISEPVRFLKGRLKFQGWNNKGEWVENKTGMFDSMIIIFDGRGKNNVR